jgi:hypothetical protein
MSISLNSCFCYAPNTAKSRLRAFTRLSAFATSLAAIASSSFSIVSFIDRRVTSLSICSFC